MAGADTSRGLGLEIRLEGSEAALKKLGEAADRLEHAAPLFDLIGAMLVTSTQRRFETGTDPQGNPWPKSIRVQLEGGRTLYDSGALFASFTHQASDAGVEVGTNDLRAAALHFGATIRPVNARALAFTIGGQDLFVQEVTIPARPFLGLDDGDEAAIEEIATDFVLQPFEAGGFNAR